MDYRSLRARQGLKGSLNELFARLYQYLDSDIVRNAILVNELAQEIEIMR